MASWKKIIVSGSDAALNSLSVSNNVVATSFTGSLSGNATSATTVNIVGTGNTDALYNLVFVTGSSGNESIRVDPGELFWNPGTNKLTLGNGEFGPSGKLTLLGSNIGGGTTNSFNIAVPALTQETNQTINLTLPSESGTLATLSDVGATANLTVSGSSTSSTVNLATQALTITGARPAVTTAVTGNAVVAVNVRDASATQDGLISTGSQTFVGTKTFSGQNTSIVLGDGPALPSGSIQFKGTTIGGTLATITLRVPTDAASATIDLPKASGTMALSEDTVNLTGDQTIAGNKTFSNNVVVGGNLTVQGDVTTLNTTNLLVEDRYILLNSGSIGNVDKGGLIIDSGNGTGKAFILGEASGRWGFTGSLAQNATTATPDAFAAAVVTSDIVEYQKVGNIRISGEDIFIYS